MPSLTTQSYRELIMSAAADDDATENSLEVYVHTGGNYMIQVIDKPTATVLSMQYGGEGPEQIIENSELEDNSGVLSGQVYACLAAGPWTLKSSQTKASLRVYAGYVG